MGTVDALVIGAGPAGAVTAGLLARRGVEVMLVDKARFPRSKTCGEGMMPAGVRMLQELGLEAEARRRGARPFFGLRFFLDREPALTLDFRELDPDLYGLIWPRRGLDPVLVDFARRKGADVLENTVAGDIRLDDSGALVELRNGTASRRQRARLLIGADGATSQLHRVLRCRRSCPRPGRFGLARVFQGIAGNGDSGDFVDVHFGTGVEAYLAPLGPHRARITLLQDNSTGSAAPGQRYSAGLKAVAGLGDRLGGARPVGPVEGAAPVSQRVSPTTPGGVFLVGDAGGSVDPILGQGLTLALHDATLAAEVATVALEGNPTAAAATYFQRRRTVFEPAFALAEQLLSVFERPAVARRVCRALTRSGGPRRKVLQMAVSLPPEPGLNTVDRLRLVAGW